MSIQVWSTQYHITHDPRIPLEFFAEHEPELHGWVLKLACGMRCFSDRTVLLRGVPTIIDSSAWTGRGTAVAPLPVPMPDNMVRLEVAQSHNYLENTTELIIKPQSQTYLDNILQWFRQSKTLPKIQPITTLEQLYGLHWRTHSTVYGGPAGLPSPGSGAGAQKGGFTTTTVSAFQAGRNAGKTSGLTRQQQQLLVQATANGLLTPQQLAAAVGHHVLDVESEPKALPQHHGIVPGEVIAWRAWIVHPDGLYSMAMSDVRWDPAAPMKGDPQDSKQGVHAFKSLSGVCNYYKQSGVAASIAIGKVALWGEIYEHELGYRAEFAKVWELCDLMLPGRLNFVEYYNGHSKSDPSREVLQEQFKSLEELRKLYAVEHRI